MKIIIVGKGGSGKDFLKSKFINRGFVNCISYTTRPPRNGEVNKIDYNFVDRSRFEDMIKIGLFQEYDEFNGWYYGTTNYDWNRSSVFIKTPEGVKKLSKSEREQSFIIYLDIPEHIRFQRLSKRNDADIVSRRIKADELAFENFKDYDIRITNPNF